MVESTLTCTDCWHEKGSNAAYRRGTPWNSQNAFSKPVFNASKDSVAQQNAYDLPFSAVGVGHFEPVADVDCLIPRNRVGDHVFRRAVVFGDRVAELRAILQTAFLGDNVAVGSAVVVGGLFLDRTAGRDGPIVRARACLMPGAFRTRNGTGQMKIIIRRIRLVDRLHRMQGVIIDPAVVDSGWRKPVVGALSCAHPLKVISRVIKDSRG